VKLIPNLAHIDRNAIDALGIPGLLLMEEAGRQVAEVVARRHQERGGHASVVIVCGKGNNGGDGFVCARRLTMLGVGPVTVIHTASAQEMRGDALTNFNLLQHVPVAVVPVSPLPAALERIARADIVVDALFGSGLSKPIEGVEAELIETLNRNPSVIAVDLPSGIDSSTGQPMGTAVLASETVTFAASKPGLHVYPGKGHAGFLHCVDIGLPASLIEADESPFQLLTNDWVRAHLPRRNPEGHKYTFGHVLVVAGSRRMPGAAVMTAEAVLRAGAGMVTLAAPEEVFSAIEVPAEVVRLPLSAAAGDGLMAAENAEALKAALSGVDVIALGPGLTQEPPVSEFLETFLPALQTFPGTVVVDADGLNLLARLKESQPGLMLSARFILTPHGGEASRLLGTSAKSSGGSLEVVRRLQMTYGAQVVLKSGAPVIATTEGRVWISPVGNDGMATAGSGDVLTGVIAGLAAQGIEPPLAALCGTYLHGLAGDKAEESLSAYAMTARDITRHLGSAFQHIFR
jgi:NAD(P)H-hydrate epimerase